MKMPPSSRTPEFNEDDFARCEVDGVIFYSCRALARLPRLRHGFSTRHGGAGSSKGGAFNLGYCPWDTPERVGENRRRFMAALGLGGGNMATLCQIHSDQGHIIQDDARQWNCRTRGDALVTRRVGMPMAVQMADCLPILMADPDSGAIAAVHAGWRGMLAGIFPKTVRSLSTAYGSRPDRLLVAVGPAIRSCCMEIGKDVALSFEEEYSSALLEAPQFAGQGKKTLDLLGVLNIQCDTAGVSSRNVYDLGACTQCNAGEFFSHRREKAACGRLMAVIARI